MANLQYIGARYVPKFFENPDDQSNDWKAGIVYEALTIVTFNNDSYTSKKPVPSTIGDPSQNPEYWACTTKYTAALIALQTTVGDHEVRIDDIEKFTNECIVPEELGAIGDGVADDTIAIQSAFRSGKNVILNNKYRITNTLALDVECNIFGTGTIIADGDFDAVIVGGDLQPGQSGWFSRKIIRLLIEKKDVNWDSATTGIILKNVMIAELHLFAANYNTGVKLLGDGFGCSYNLFTNCRMYNCKYGITMSELNSGWCNQNTFIGGSIAWYHGYASQHASAADPCKGLIIVGNENSFYNFCVDGQGTQQSDYDIYKGIDCAGNWCHFDHIRLERVGSVDFSGRWCYVIEPYMFLEYTTVNRTYENSVIIQNNKSIEFIAEGEELIKVKTVRSGLSSLFAGYNTSNDKVIDLKSDGKIETKNNAYFYDKHGVIGFATNPETFDSALDESSAYMIYDSNGSDPAVSNVLGVHYSDSVAAQFAFTAGGRLYNRIKSGSTWGAWKDIFQPIATTAKVAAVDYSTSLTCKKSHANVPAILIVGGNGVSAIDMYLCWDVKIVKVYDGSTNININYSKDADNNVSITASTNCGMIFIYE